MQLVRVAFTFCVSPPPSPTPRSRSLMRSMLLWQRQKREAAAGFCEVWRMFCFLARERVGHPVFCCFFFFEAWLCYKYSLIIRCRPNEMFLWRPWERFFSRSNFFFSSVSKTHQAMMDDEDRRCWNASTFTDAAAQLEKPTRFFFLTRLQLAPSLCLSAREQSCCSCSSMSKSWGEGAKVREMPKDNKQKVSLQKGLGGYFFFFFFSQNASNSSEVRSNLLEECVNP